MTRSVDGHEAAMDREEAVQYLKEKVQTDHLVLHSLAVSNVMQHLAHKFEEDEKRWGLAGLLHDIDYEETVDDPEKHSKVGATQLRDQGFDEEICHAVEAHNDAHEIPRKNKMAQALYCADPVTGLIVASALIHPDKTLASVDKEFLLNRYSESSFAKGANRAQIASCLDLDMSIEEFLDLSLEAMQEISEELKL